MYTKTKNIRKERAAKALEVQKNSWWYPLRNATPRQKLNALDSKFGVNQGASRQRMKLLAQIEREAAEAPVKKAKKLPA